MNIANLTADLTAWGTAGKNLMTAIGAVKAAIASEDIEAGIAAGEALLVALEAEAAATEKLASDF